MVVEGVELYEAPVCEVLPERDDSRSRLGNRHARTAQGSVPTRAPVLGLRRTLVEERRDGRCAEAGESCILFDSKPI